MQGRRKTRQAASYLCKFRLISNSDEFVFVVAIAHHDALGRDLRNKVLENKVDNIHLSKNLRDFLVAWILTTVVFQKFMF